MQHVIISRSGGKPVIAVGQRLFNPGIQERAGIGLIPTAADVLQAPFERKDTAVVVRGPPGVLVAAYSLFEPGHSLLAIEYRGVREACQTRLLLLVCFTPCRA